MTLIKASCFSFLMLFITCAFAKETSTETPIKHIVVIFQENRPFDHYFGTYQHALNPKNEPRLIARKDTPRINGLTIALRENNQNLHQPFRLSRSQVNTC